MCCRVLGPAARNTPTIFSLASMVQLVPPACPHRIARRAGGIARPRRREGHALQWDMV
jgi:hypothetical protein